MGPMPPDAAVDSAQQIAQGFLRIAQVLRQDGYRGRERHGLSVTQAQVIALIDARGPLRVGGIARELGITSATASDSLRALEAKGLIERSPAAEDRRATVIALSRSGRAVAPQVGESIVRLMEAVVALPDHTRSDLLAALVALVGELAAAGVIAPARLCTSCSWFAPGVHPGDARPHHCRFIDAALGPADLRIECPDHLSMAAPAP